MKATAVAGTTGQFVVAVQTKNMDGPYPHITG